jgi:hypothetical protein
LDHFKPHPDAEFIDLSPNGCQSTLLDRFWTITECDRAMVCGNLAFNLEIKDMLEGYGLVEGANSNPQHYVVEKAFLD